MKIKMETIVKKPVGNVVPGYSKIVDAMALEDKGDSYSIWLNSNHELVLTKKYWKVELV